MVNKLLYQKEYGVDFELVPKLRISEFQCKCQNEHCHYVLVDPRLLHSYALFRKALDKSVKITSGFRCQKHNEIVGGRKNSYHTQGSAIDISLQGHDRRIIIKLANRYFNFVKVYGNFIHCDVRP